MRYLTLLLALVASTAHADWPVLAEGGQRTGQHVDAERVLSEIDVDWGSLFGRFSAHDLAQVAHSTLDAMDEAEASGRPVPVGMLEQVGVDAEDLRATLQFIVDVESEDRGAPYQRLADPDWLAAHFRVLRWRSDMQAASRHNVPLREGRVRLTRYLVYRFAGSPVRTSVYDTALYSVPADERTGATALGSVGQLLRLALTRREVLDGAYESGGGFEGQAQPLVYLKREHVHQALLQGTVQVSMPDGQLRTFGVHRNNGRAYRRGADSESQERFWYFREQPTRSDNGIDSGVVLQPMVAVAGDVQNMGFGGLYALQGDDSSLRLAIMADTGGAFQPNLYQLDLFAGTYDSRAAFDTATADIPRRVDAYLLVLRSPLEP